jgi:hypothetical protein
MMIKSITKLLPLFILTGCLSFPVVISKDPFKGTSVVTADMWHTVIDSRIDNLRVLYQKEIVNGEISEPTVSFVFAADIDPYFYNYHGEGLKPEAYILADSRSFRVDLMERNNENRQGASYFYDYPVFIPFYRGFIITSRRQRILTAQLKLTPEIQKAVINSKNYMIRFYFGDNPLTLEATPKQLESVKKFLAAGITTSQ